MELSMSPLRRRMIEDMQIRNLTPNRQRVYVANVVRFTVHFRKSPDLLGPAEIRTYLLHLTRERRLAASSIIITVSALRFFYTVTLKGLLDAKVRKATRPAEGYLVYYQSALIRHARVIRLRETRHVTSDRRPSAEFGPPCQCHRTSRGSLIWCDLRPAKFDPQTWLPNGTPETGLTV
jgi:hypothetical protein